MPLFVRARQKVPPAATCFAPPSSSIACKIAPHSSELVGIIDAVVIMLAAIAQNKGIFGSLSCNKLYYCLLPNSSML